LDWSESLFVAAYFALSSKDSHKEHECKPVVWVVDPVAWNRSRLTEHEDAHILTTSDSELDPYEPKKDRKRQKSPVAMYGTHNSQRIVSQRGTFFVWGSDASPMEEIAAGVDSETFLWKIELSGERAKLLDDLRGIGVSETTLFPEMTALADELNRTEAWKS